MSIPQTSSSLTIMDDLDALMIGSLRPINHHCPAIAGHTLQYRVYPLTKKTTFVKLTLRYSFQLSKNFQRKYERHIICLTFSERARDGKSMQLQQGTTVTENIPF